MITTASSFLIKTKNTWSGSVFSVTNSKNQILFESHTRSPAFAALLCFKNNIDYVTVQSDRIRLKSKYYLMFNSLVTKYRLGKPITKEMLASGVIPLKSGSLDINNGLYTSSRTTFQIYQFSTLDEIFLLISKDK